MLSLVFIALTLTQGLRTSTNGFVAVLARLDALEEANMQMKLECAQMKSENAIIKAKLEEHDAAHDAAHDAVGDVLPNELRIFYADECPRGWIEFNRTQGFLMMPRPRGGKVGTTLNRAMDAGETARSPPHEHDVSIEDLGHTHTMVVNDPGHSHTLYTIDPETPGHGTGPMLDPTSPAKSSVFQSATNKTGIVVDAQVAYSNIKVSLASSQPGEGYPLVYVLVCQATRAITRM